MKVGVVPILKRKFVAPALPPVYLRRERLVEPLDGARVAVVWGGPGYGKSLLLAELSSQDSLWLTLEAADASPVVFLSHLVAGLSQLLPDLSSAPAQQLATAEPDRAEEPVLARLTEEVAELAPDLLAILDGVDALAAGLLERLVAYWPGRLLLASRTRPALASDVEIGPEALRFTQAETVELVSLSGGDPTIGKALCERTSGWPAGVSLGARADAEALRSDRPLHELISTQVLDGLPADAREDLLACAMLPGGAAALIPLTTAPEALAQLDALAAQSFLLSKAQDGYVFHPLFKAALQDAAAQSWPTERLSAFHRGVASAIAKDDPEGAVDHWLSAGAWPEAGTQLRGLADPLLGQGRASTVRSWLDRLPWEFREGSDTLSVIEGDIARLAGRMVEALSAYDRAYQIAERAHDERAAAWALALSAAAGKGAQAAQAALDRAPAAEPGLKAFAYDQLGLHHLREGDLGPAATYLQEAASLYRGAGDASGLARVSTHLGRVLAAGGQFERALAVLDEARQAAKAAQRIPPPEASAGAARVRALRQEIPEAWALAEQAADDARRIGDRRGEAEALAALGHIARLSGQARESEIYLEDALGMARDLADAALYSVAAVDLAELALSRAQSGQARERLEDARKFRQESIPRSMGDRRKRDTGWLSAESAGNLATGVPVVLGRRTSDAPPAEWLAEIAVDMSEGQLERAETALNGLLPLLERGDLRYELTRARFLQSRLLAAQGKADRSREALDVARKLARQYQYGWLDEEERGRTPSVTVAGLALEAQLLGRMKVKVDGEPVAQSAWRAAKAKLLLAHLLTSRHGSGKEELVSLFFAGDAKGSSLHVLIARLRAALEPGLDRNASSRFILFGEGRYRFNFALRHRIDAADFAFHVSQARQARGAERQSHLRQAIDLYSGPFLAEFDEPWVEAERERFRREAAWAFSELSTALEGAGQHGAVLDLADRQIQLDRTAQEAHRAKMRALGRMGRREDALKHYKLVERILKQEIGTAPDSETVDLHLQILRGSLK